MKALFWRHPVPRALAAALACLILGIALFLVADAARDAERQSFLRLQENNHAYLELLGIMRLELESAALAVHLAAAARDGSSLAAREAELTESLRRIRQALMVARQGGRYVRDDGGQNSGTRDIEYWPASNPDARLMDLAEVVGRILRHASSLIRAQGWRFFPGVPASPPQDGEEPAVRCFELIVEAKAKADQLHLAAHDQIHGLSRGHGQDEYRALLFGAVGFGGGAVAMGVGLCLHALRLVRRLLDERDRDAAAVLEAQAGLDRLLEALPVGVVLVGPDQNIRRVNLATSDLLGIGLDWLARRQVRWEMFCPTSTSTPSSPFVGYPRRGDFESEVCLQRLDGGCIDAVKSSIPVILQGESLTLEVFADITTRKRAERALLQEKSRLESVLAGIAEGVTLTDDQGLILAVNECLARILDRPSASVLGAPISSLFSDARSGEALRQGLERLRANPVDKIQGFEIGSFRNMALMVRMQPVVEDDDFAGIVVSVIEVTEIVEARRRAEAASQAKTMFLANVSHEIRTPLNSIVGLGEVLSHTALDPEQGECLRTIRICADNLLGIINDILDFSKIEAGMFKVEAEDVHLRVVLEKVVAVFADQARKKDVELALLTSNLPDVVRADGTRLTQVLLNLVGNAIKFTPGGEVVLAVRCGRRGSAEDPACVFFTVRDTGIGIDAKRQERIFSSFEQADGSLTRQYGGTGLGLTIANSLVKLMGGDGIAVCSALEEGSEFSFTLKLDVPRKSVAESVPPVSATLRTFPHVRVLAAEDNPFNRALLQKMLKTLGVERLELVVNGQDAVNLLATDDDFDIIFMDIQMPVLDGLEAAKAIRTMGLSIPIIALTAHVLGADHLRSMEAGMNGHLLKPYKTQDLVDALSTWCPEI